MSTPAIIYATLTALTFLGYCIMDGKPRSNPNWSLEDYIPNLLIGTILLAWGGFYS